MSGPDGGAVESIEGRPLRRFPAAVSAGAMALAWANQEEAPDGALVVVDHEVSPIGLRGELWPVAHGTTLAVAAVLRPPLSDKEADIPWLSAGLAVVDALESHAGPSLSTWWPDKVVDESGRTVAATRADVRLGPGAVRCAVVTARVDIGAPATTGLDRAEVLALLAAGFDRASRELALGAAAVAARYEARCALLGRRLKVRLLPKGEARGTPRGVDRLARLELASPTGMVERLSVDMVRDLEEVNR